MGCYGNPRIESEFSLLPLVLIDKIDFSTMVAWIFRDLAGFRIYHCLRWLGADIR